MTRQTRVVCDGCGRTMLGEPRIGIGAMAIRLIAEQGADPGWHDLDGGRDMCPACWAEGKR